MKKTLSVLFALSLVLILALPAYGASGLKPTNGNSYIVTRHLTVVNEEGENIYASPDRDSRVLSTLEYGTEIKTTRRYFDSKFDGILTNWYYTIVDGTGGWVDADPYKCNFAGSVKYHEDVPARLGSMKTVSDCALHASLDFAEGEGAGETVTVPAGTELEYDLCCEYSDCVYGRVNYEGSEGWIAVEDFYIGDVMSNVDGYIMTAGAKPLYEDDGCFPGSQAKGVTDPFRIYSYDWSFSAQPPYDEDEPNGRWYRIQTDEGLFWIFSALDDEDSVFDGGSTYKIKNGASLEMYSGPDDASEKAGEIPADSEYICIFSVEFDDRENRNDSARLRIWDYVKYENSYGWAERIYSYPDITVVQSAEAPLKTLKDLPQFRQESSEDGSSGEDRAVSAEPAGEEAEKEEQAKGRPVIISLAAVAAVLLIAAVWIARVLTKKNK